MKFKENDLVHSDVFGKGVVVNVSQNKLKTYVTLVMFLETQAYFTSEGEYFKGMSSMADIVIIPEIPQNTEIHFH